MADCRPGREETVLSSDWRSAIVTSRRSISTEIRFVLFIADFNQIRKEQRGLTFVLLQISVAILGSSSSRIRVRFGSLLHDQFSHEGREGVLKTTSIPYQFRLNSFMSFITRGLIKFEEYEIDRARWRVSWRGEVVSLNRKTFDLLLYLVDNADRVVTKEELLRTLWPESFVEEGNLTQHIFLLRKALSRHDSGKKIIETIAGRGYHFAAVWTEELPASNETVITTSESITRITIEEEEEVESFDPTLPLPSTGSAEFYRAKNQALLRSASGRPVTLTILWTIGAAMTVALLASWLLMRQPRLRIVDAVRLTNDGVQKALLGSTNAVVSDGSRLIFVEKRDNQSVFADVSVDGGSVRSRPAPFADAAIADYSGVNHKLLIGSAWRTHDDRPILTESLQDMTLTRVGELTGHDASWSPDARRIAVAKGRYLYIADADGSNQRRVVSAAGIVYAPAWSPRGHTLRFSVNLGSTENQIWEVDENGGNLHQLFAGTPNADQVCCGAWSADGRDFYFIVEGIASSAIWVAPHDPALSLFHRPKAIQLTAGQSDFWQEPLPTPDGHALWAIGSLLRGELMTVDPTTRQIRSFLGGISAEGVSFSPDGSSIVYTGFPEGTLWRSRADGSEKQQLTKPPLVARFPQWSPDGRTIAFMGTQPGSVWRIYLMSSAGGDLHPMLEENSTQGVPNWSPDGKQIVFGRLLDFGNELDPNLTIELYDLDRHSHRTLPGSEGLWTPRWSPNGRFLSAVTEDNRTLRLFDNEKQQWTDLANEGVNDVIWSRDSRYLYFDTLFGAEPTLYRVPIETRKLERWADLRGFSRGGFYGPWLGITPDGSPLLLKDTSIEEIYRLDLQGPN
jgi:Tol biopolymer transport system component/DNA-binding winged helix-turn-helix (wHTH) protein